MTKTISMIVVTLPTEIRAWLCYRKTTTRLSTPLVAVLTLVGRFREVFRGAKIEVGGDGTIKIRHTDYKGRRETSRYRYSRREQAPLWEEEADDD